jgi:hypothetical protein
MSFKSKILAAAATLTLVGGVGATGMLTAGAASAATPSCGKNCIDLFSQKFGTHKHPNFVLDVYQTTAKVGQPVILFQASNYDKGQDFTIAFQGTVNDFYKAGLATASLNLHYSKLWAYEIEYSPNGVDSGLCVGVPTTAANGTPVSLQPCGVSAKTVWVKDTIDSIKTHTVPLINGSDTNFSHPYVLTYPTNAHPTDMPRPQLTVTNLTGFSNGFGGPELGTVNGNQLWGANFGVLH